MALDPRTVLEMEAGRKRLLEIVFEGKVEDLEKRFRSLAISIFWDYTKYVIKLRVVTPDKSILFFEDDPDTFPSNELITKLSLIST